MAILWLNDGASYLSYDDPNDPYLVTRTDKHTGASTQTTYKSNGDVSTVEDPYGNVTTYLYPDDVGDTNIPPGNEHLVRKIQRPEVTVQGELVSYDPTEFKYDSKGNLVEIIDARGKSTLMTYTADGMVDSITDRNGHATEFVYEGAAFDNGYRRLTQIKVPKGLQTSDGFRTVSFAYADSDNPLNVTGVTDDLTNTVTTEYDILDRVTKATDALGNFTEYVYEDGVMKTVKLPPNQASGSTARKVSMVYDVVGRVTEVLRDISSSAQQTRVKYEYNLYGEVTKMTRLKDSVEKSFRFNYDKLGRNIMTYDSLNNFRYTAWEDACEGHATTTARGIRHSQGIDLMCRPTLIETGDPEFNDLLSGYDPEGSQTEEEYVYEQIDSLFTDPSLLELDTTRELRRFYYDELGRIVRSLQSRAFYGQAIYGTDRYAEERTYLYDELDRLLEMTLEGGKTISWEYDDEGNVTKMTDPEGKVTKYQYYRDNLLYKVVIERNGVDVGEFVYTYDAVGRLDEIQYPSSTGITAVFRDAANNPGSGFDGNGNLRFLRYEKSGVTDPLRSFEWTYDDSGNRQSMLDVDSTRAVKWEYGFDWLDRLVTVKRDEASTVGGLTTATLQREYVFDESDNRTFFDDHVNDVTYHYKYRTVDKDVPVYSQEELRQLILTYVSQNFSQVIDDIEEIIEGDIENATGQTLQELELLAEEDLEGFVGLMEGATGQSIVEIYGDDFQEFDVITYYSDQIEEILIYDTAAGHRTVEDFVSLETFLHDDDGNMTKRTIVDTSEEIDYEWTEFDRLKSVESSANGQLQEAKYNIDGLRHRKTDKNGNSSEEYGVGIGTTASAPSSSSSNAPEISYVAGHMLLGAEIDGTFVFHLGDALSTVRDVVNDSGTVIKSFEFDEYGNLLSATGSGTTSPKTWIGGLSVNDDRADSGMFNMGHRNYAAGVLGRFISRDPIGHAGGLNLYGYPTNPVNALDPVGLSPNLGDVRADYYCTKEQNTTAVSDEFLIFGVGGFGLVGGAYATFQGAAFAAAPKVSLATAGILAEAAGIPMSGITLAYDASTDAAGYILTSEQGGRLIDFRPDTITLGPRGLTSPWQALRTIAHEWFHLKEQAEKGLPTKASCALDYDPEQDAIDFEREFMKGLNKGTLRAIKNALRPVEMLRVMREGPK